MQFNLVVQLENGELETRAIELDKADPAIRKLETLINDDNVVQALPLALRAIRSLDKKASEEHARILWLTDPPQRHAA